MCVRVSVFTCGASEPNIRVCLRVEWREGGREGGIERRTITHIHLTYMKCECIERVNLTQINVFTNQYWQEMREKKKRKRKGGKNR